MNDPQNDPRSVDDLFNAALTEADEDIAWNAVSALHLKGTAEVFHRASTLCKSACAIERRVGADVLGQLGVPERTFPKECGDQLLAMLPNEQDAEVLHAIFVAFSHLHDRRVLSVAPRYASHPAAEVRHAVVLALTGYEEDAAVDVLIALTTDTDSHVRDWATFALGTQLDLDVPKIRAALRSRLADEDDDTRAEAHMGLARRKDHEVVSAIAAELQRPVIGSLTIEAAEVIAAPELHPYLVALRRWSDIDFDLLERAIQACSSKA